MISIVDIVKGFQGANFLCMYVCIYIYTNIHVLTCVNTYL